MVKDSGTQTSSRALRALSMPRAIPVNVDEDKLPRYVRGNGRRILVEAIVDLWRIEDEWWREHPISRSYYDVRLSDGRSLTIFQDELTQKWYTQRYG